MLRVLVRLVLAIATATTLISAVQIGMVMAEDGPVDVRVDKQYGPGQQENPVIEPAPIGDRSASGVVDDESSKSGGFASRFWAKVKDVAAVAGDAAWKFTDKVFGFSQVGAAWEAWRNGSGSGWAFVGALLLTTVKVVGAVAVTAAAVVAAPIVAGGIAAGGLGGGLAALGVAASTSATVAASVTVLEGAAMGAAMGGVGGWFQGKSAADTMADTLGGAFMGGGIGLALYVTSRAGMAMSTRTSTKTQNQLVEERQPGTAGSQPTPEAEPNTPDAIQNSVKGLQKPVSPSQVPEDLNKPETGSISKGGNAVVKTQAGERLANSNLKSDAELQNSIKRPVPVSPGTSDYEFNTLNPGPLPNTIAKNFGGGKYNVEVLAEDTVLYRAGTVSKPWGQWFTRTPPTSEAGVRIDLAVKPIWTDSLTQAEVDRSPIDSVFAIKLPARTTIYSGPVASQGGPYMGGAEQIFISRPQFIPGAEVLKTWRIVK